MRLTNLVWLYMIIAAVFFLPFAQANSPGPGDTPQKIVFDPSPHAMLSQLVENHQEIKTYAHKVESAQTMLRQSKGLYYPSLDLYGDAGKEGIEKEFNESTHQWRHEVTLKGTQLITDFGKTIHTIDRDEIALAQARAGKEAVTQRMLRQGISAYIGIVRAREQLKSVLYSENRIKELTGIEKALVNKGAGLTSDVLQAKSQLAGAMALRVEAEGELQMAKNRFQAIFYYYPNPDQIDLFQEVPLPEQALPASLDSAVDTALEHHPEIKLTQYDLDLRRQDIKISKSTYYPRFNLFGEYIDANDDAGVQGYRRDYSAGVEFSYNLFRGGSDLAAVKSATASKSAASTHLNHSKKLVQEQPANSWEQFFTLTRRKELLDQQTRILERFLDLAQKKRTMGTRSLLDVLNGEVNYINAQATAIAAREEMKIAAYNLLFSMGKINLDLFSF
ncbi:MAG: TolC family protein [Desulfobacter sp.]|nr:TolC family protein [Desulfobacter sp.]